MKSPAIVHFSKRPFKIFDQYFKPCTIKRDAACECLIDQFIGNRHVGDDNLPTIRFSRPLAYLKRTAQWDEFGIVLDLGNKLEHVGRGMSGMPLGRELRHYRCDARAALSRAKSSPA